MGQYMAHASLPQSKFPTTIDIKFDNQNSESQVKEDAMNKYQENAYLIGKLFSIEGQTQDQEQDMKMQEDASISDDSSSNSASFQIQDD